MVKYLYSEDCILRILTPWNYLAEGQNKWLECEVIRTWHPIYKIGDRLTVNAMNWRIW